MKKPDDTVKLNWTADAKLPSSGRHIRCADYDYIEIMCLHRYRVTVTMKDLSQYHAQFHTTSIIEFEGIKRETILGVDINQAPLQLMLNEILSITVLDDNAQFSKLQFD
ncbi:Rho-binding antiterminator [Shewanella sp. SR44-3]|uniref:Rho-binding antiterminator n=1 Tax=unclassified Shewanella TaxID=196818 RepID=UPI0015FC2FFE|nr:Rho-binding antiterminator [Shewanella sp. SR44-3]MBB1270374.1 Rho-binding antiterminator [Shewanella sp. SR44-3]